MVGWKKNEKCDRFNSFGKGIGNRKSHTSKFSKESRSCCTQNKCGDGEPCAEESLEKILCTLKEDIRKLSKYQQSVVRCPMAGIPSYEPCYILNEMMNKVGRLEKLAKLRKSPKVIFDEEICKLKKEVKILEDVRNLRSSICESKLECNIIEIKKKLSFVNDCLDSIENNLCSIAKNRYLECMSVKKTTCPCGPKNPPPNFFTPTECQCGQNEEKDFHKEKEKLFEKSSQRSSISENQLESMEDDKKEKSVLKEEGIKLNDDRKKKVNINEMGDDEECDCRTKLEIERKNLKRKTPSLSKSCCSLEGMLDWCSGGVTRKIRSKIDEQNLSDIFSKSKTVSSDLQKKYRIFGESSTAGKGICRSSSTNIKSKTAFDLKTEDCNKTPSSELVNETKKLNNETLSKDSDFTEFKMIYTKERTWKGIPGGDSTRRFWDWEDINMEDDGELLKYQNINSEKGDKSIVEKEEYKILKSNGKEIIEEKFKFPSDVSEEGNSQRGSDDARSKEAGNKAKKLSKIWYESAKEICSSMTKKLNSLRE